MYNSNELSLDSVNTAICQHCGNPTIVIEENTSQKAGIFYPILGWLFTLIALIFVPIFFGVIAFAMGLFTYYERSRTHGSAIMVFSSFSIVLGSMLSFFVSGTLFF